MQDSVDDPEPEILGTEREHVRPEAGETAWVRFTTSLKAWTPVIVILEEA
jgi:hypothetical protein